MFSSENELYDFLTNRLGEEDANKVRCFVDDLIGDAETEAENRGYDNGYDDGLNDGREEGYDEARSRLDSLF